MTISEHVKTEFLYCIDLYDARGKQKEGTAPLSCY
jgi:hypothetical protein